LQLPLGTLGGVLEISIIPPGLEHPSVLGSSSRTEPREALMGSVGTEQPPKWLRSRGGNIKGISVLWHPDSGADTISSDYPAALQLTWEQPEARLTTADGQLMNCEGVRRRLRLYRVAGLLTSAILDKYVLYQESTMNWSKEGESHFYQLGSDRCRVFPGRQDTDKSCFAEGLRLVSIDSAIDQSTIKFFNRQEG
jgi:hypothetical protein